MKRLLFPFVVFSTTAMQANNAPTFVKKQEETPVRQAARDIQDPFSVRRSLWLAMQTYTKAPKTEFKTNMLDVFDRIHVCYQRCQSPSIRALALKNPDEDIEKIEARYRDDRLHFLQTVDSGVVERYCNRVCALFDKVLKTQRFGLNKNIVPHLFVSSGTHDAMTHIVFDKAFISITEKGLSNTDEELEALLRHEVSHCLHPDLARVAVMTEKLYPEGIPYVDIVEEAKDEARTNTAAVFGSPNPEETAKILVSKGYHARHLLDLIAQMKNEQFPNQ